MCDTADNRVHRSDNRVRGRLTHDIGASHLSARSTFSNEVDGGAVDLVRECLCGRVLQYAPRSKTRHHRLGAEVDRSRAGVRPISVRKWTDLEPECDRSRCGSGPISSRSATDLGTGFDRSRRGRAPQIRSGEDCPAERRQDDAVALGARGRGVARRGQDDLVPRRGQPGLGLLQAEDEYRLSPLSALSALVLG